MGVGFLGEKIIHVAQGIVGEVELGGFGLMQGLLGDDQEKIVGVEGNQIEVIFDGETDGEKGLAQLRFELGEFGGFAGAAVAIDEDGFVFIGCAGGGEFVGENLANIVLGAAGLAGFDKPVLGF